MKKYELLALDFEPARTGSMTFADAFSRILKRADELYIAVGYISAESLAELRRIAELNGINRIVLIIGMHYAEKFTRRQYSAAVRLNKFLHDNGMGEVRLVTPFRYHGKLYLAAEKSRFFAGIIGSDNLNSIVNHGSSLYELSLLLEEQEIISAMKDFADKLKNSASSVIDECVITDFAEYSPALSVFRNIKQALPEEIRRAENSLTGVSFSIPISTEPKSSLNVYFGKGRKNKYGSVIPRHWYEAEIIVPKSITSLEGYPQSGTDSAVFDVITDDGFKFRCRISGNNSKNLRSEGDLRILGRWIKGRLEDSGALTTGEPVTREVLAEYGRNTLTLSQTSVPGLWYLDFGADKDGR